ncbi:MAG: NADH-ubiquinone oxidoreductase-F iron-sulfur binding region domain-containing protein [Patescibacteria group bacterium]|nr:NADH-ubiquinone oxidoreductase-F iron-sulfur binding region domain-containing protein [Patescibacteria group bacterium]
MRNISKIAAARLTGRGGAEFPTAFKWLAVAKAKLEKFDRPAYIICNATEGEPGVFKDKHILRYFPGEVINGIRIALEELGAEKAYIYVQRKDLNTIKKRLTPFIKKLPIRFFAEDGGYLCGEETTLLEQMEGRRPEPRLRPPFPTEHGLHGCPTLVNNVETFYYISQIVKDEYRHTRFYCLSGAIRNPGVFELPIDLTIAEVLKKTKNIPRCKFFLQVGGGAAGEILLPDETNRPLKGAGAIIVYDRAKTKPQELMTRWIEFFFKSNCGKCAPCREGLYRLREELKKAKPDWLMMRAILETMRDASFCALGKSVYTPMLGLLEKV